MATETAFRSEERFTREEFWDWLDGVPASDINRYELLAGRVVMTPPAKWGHGYAESNVNRIIASHVHAVDLGVTFGSSTGYDLPTGDTLEPDFAFVSKERWGRGPRTLPGGKGFLAIVPDLVVEILSPSTATRDRTEKKQAYERSGVDEYWIADPARREVTVFVREGAAFEPARVTSAGAIRSRALPGLRISVEVIFAEPG
jgi:Uma2 family endonuclease